MSPILYINTHIYDLRIYIIFYIYIYYLQKSHEISRIEWFNLGIAHKCIIKKIFFCVRDTDLYYIFLMFLFLNRLFGIKSVIQTDCSSTWKIIANPDLSWYHHANPILLLVMYYTLATLIRIWLQEPLVRIKRFLWTCLQSNLEAPGEIVYSY